MTLHQIHMKLGSSIIVSGIFAPIVAETDVGFARIRMPRIVQVMIVKDWHMIHASHTRHLMVSHQIGIAPITETTILFLAIIIPTLDYEVDGKHGPVHNLHIHPDHPRLIHKTPGMYHFVHQPPTNLKHNYLF